MAVGSYARMPRRDRVIHCYCRTAYCILLSACLGWLRLCNTGRDRAARVPVRGHLCRHTTAPTSAARFVTRLAAAAAGRGVRLGAARAGHAAGAGAAASGRAEAASRPGPAGPGTGPGRGRSAGGAGPAADVQDRGEPGARGRLSDRGREAGHRPEARGLRGPGGRRSPEGRDVRARRRAGPDVAGTGGDARAEHGGAGARDGGRLEVASLRASSSTPTTSPAAAR